MRKLKFFSLIVCCLAAMSLTFSSCSDDDDNNGSLSPKDYQTAFNAVRGSYSGKVYFPVPDEKTNKYVTDSATVSWSIQKDSAMTIHNFPVAALGANVADSAAREAIMSQAPQDIKCAITFIHLSPVTFIIAPTTVELNLNYNKKDHKIQIPFYVSYVSYGQQVSSTGVFMQIVEGAIYQDGSLQQSWLSKGIPFKFISKDKI